jgi:hypothetical protein
MTAAPDPIDPLDDLLEGDELDLFGLGIDEPSPIANDLTALYAERNTLAERIASAVVSFNPKPTAPPTWAQGERS